jgi:hypothetical protein
MRSVHGPSHKVRQWSIHGLPLYFVIAKILERTLFWFKKLLSDFGS